MKYCEYKTGVIGDYDSFGDSLYGYDIVAFESNQGVGETCVLTWAAENDSRAAYGQIGYQFFNLISKKSLTVDLTYELHEPTQFNIRHYIIDADGNETLYASSTESHSYGEYINIRKKSITGYTLDSDYLSSITGTFTYDILGASENIGNILYYNHVHGSKHGEMYRWTSYQESEDDYICYCENRQIAVNFYYNLRTYTVKFNANDGTSAPANITKTYGIDITLPYTIPVRDGYKFVGWGTYPSDTTPDYFPGGTYSSNVGRTLYAIWESDSETTYTVSYNANGGVGAPASQSIVKAGSIALSMDEPTRSGYTFLGWSENALSSFPDYLSGDTYICNSSVTLYAVWAQNTSVPPSVTYTVSYNANGGSGAPSAQYKNEDETLTLSYVKPQRSGYDFLGWSASSTATSASYDPGDSYIANESVVLYAVWQKTNYDFSVSNLSVSNSEPNCYDQITVKVRADSWDRINAYSNIPIDLYYDGNLVATKYANFSAYGLANVTFTLNVGGIDGDKDVEVRINWNNHNKETRTSNNSISGSITVKNSNYELSAEPIIPTDKYIEGMDVISSFTVSNDSDKDVLPTDKNTARFTAYYYNGSQKVVISTQDWDDVVIPAAGTNLVYFKWTVPTGLNGKTVYLDCTVNADRHMSETNYDNNTASFSTTISTVANSQTPNTRFESEAPSSYQNASTPAVSTDKATWTKWEYENGSFVLKRYAVQISSVSPVVAPSTDCVTAIYENGKWTMRSGYGITMSYAPSISTVSGYDRPDSNAYTSVQYVVATFPEFRYFDTNGNCRTLQYVDGSYQFVQNPDADGNARVHFIPVYSVTRDLEREHHEKEYELASTAYYDVLNYEGSLAGWEEVIAVYAVKLNLDIDNPQEVATFDESKAEALRVVFLNMNELSLMSETLTSYVTRQETDANGNVVEVAEEINTVYVTVITTPKSAAQIAEEYGFTAQQKEMLTELLSSENAELWAGILGEGYCFE